MGKLTFLGLAEKVLSEAGRPLSPSEIWAIAESKSYHKSLDSEGKTPAQTLYSAIFTDARNNPNSLFIKIGDRPARYYLKSEVRQRKLAELEEAVAEADAISAVPGYRENQLHPFLAYFANAKFGAHCKTISHARSRKKEFGEWVHPDMVGVSYPDWRDEVRELSQITGSFNVRIYSFELKRSLSFSNLRESFFQAVSNSSWAHEGYLVAADISTDEDFRAELRRLSASFKIGIIELDIESPGSSQVLVPAEGEDDIDWDALDKVAMNPDVQEFLRRVAIDARAKKVHAQEYDQVLQVEQLVASIQTRRAGA